MPHTFLKVIKVFIGSPGGLEEERRAAKRIVDEVNQSHAEHWGCQIQLVGWEATLPGYSRAQSLINQDLDKCQYFTGLIWNHWGSKPSDGDSRYSSGFEEEFERAKARLRKGLMKNIALFFKDIPEVQLRDLGPSVKKVVEFRKRCIKRRKPLFKEFKDTTEFESRFRATVESIGWQESQIGDASEEASDLGRPARTDRQSAGLSTNTDALFGAPTAKFVADLLQRPSQWEAVTPFEVARLRLVASSISRSGNDEAYLGNHDANLLYMERGGFDFSDREIRALIDTAVVGFHDQNVPLWHWLVSPSGMANRIERVKLLAAIGNSQEKANAIRILQSLGESTPSIDGTVSREEVIRSWLSGHSSAQELKAALEFLKTNGDVADLSIMEQLLDEVPADQKDRLAATIIAMYSTRSVTIAFAKLTQLDPDPIGDDVAAQLFSHPESIPTETLESCLALKSDEIRKRVAVTLHSRQAIDTETAEQLMTDSDPEVRLVAVESLLRLGRPLQKETIRKALIQPEARGLLASAFMGSNYDNEEYYERYRANQLSRLSFEELRQKADESGIHDYLEVSVLNNRFRSKRLSEMRSDLEDGFKSHFESKFQKVASLPGIDGKLLDSIRNLEGYLRQRLTTNTLDALCARKNRADLKVVRQTLDRHKTDFSQHVLQFLTRFGDWSDKDHILLFCDRYSSGGLLVREGTRDRIHLIAEALYAVGKHRVTDLLKLNLNIAIRRALVARLTRRDVDNLSDDSIIEELNNEDDQLRKIVALKCSQAASRARVRRILDRYINQDRYRYYNSIHWLDLGASMPQQIANRVASFQLMKAQPQR